MNPTAWLVILVLVSAPWLASGQSDSSQADASEGEVSLRLSSAGVGGVVRPGDWAGLQIELSDNGESQREILIQVQSVGQSWDADDDTPLYQRAIASNPGRPQRSWLYVRLPHAFGAGDAVQISAYEAVEGDGPNGFVSGELLARTQATFPAVLDPGAGAMLVVGRTPGGLRGYMDRGAGSRGVARTTGHEVTEIWGNLVPTNLPDRWAGLSAYEVIVWTDARVSDLTSDRAEALLAWIERGGHLVVGPRSGSGAWYDFRRNPLEPAFPRVSPREIDASLADLLLVRDGESVPRGLRLSAYDLDDSEESIPLLLAQDGSPVVVRRGYGLGAITLVGVDLANGTLADRGLPRMESFWHRVLGWRGTREADADASDDSAVNQSVFAGRELAFLDADVRGEISKSGPAAAGVLMGLVTFLIYLVVAGPLGFFVLKKMDRVKHAWTLYVVTAIVFTGIAWGGAQALRPRIVEIQHLTYFDSVDGSDVSRTRTWASVLLPSYGDARISVPGGIVAAWESPVGGASALQGFPDVRPYAVDGRGASEITVPTRSTVKQVRADWSGESGWGTIRSVSADGLGSGQLRIDVAGRPVGTLSHSFPGELENVVILVNRGQLSMGSDPSERFNAAAWVYQLSGAASRWSPGQALDLAEITRGSDQGAATAELYFRELARDRGLLQVFTDDGTADLQNAPERLAAASWISQVAPPDATTDSATIAALRRETWGLDLGRWFTQPCVIVIGQLSGQTGLATPIQIGLDGASPQEIEATTGRTIVRWVYPLPASPPRWPARLAEPESVQPDDS